MIELEYRPILAPKVRLRWDQKGGRYLLLYPERGIALNPTSAEIVKRCTGELTVADIIGQLKERYTSAPSATIERDVLSFLEDLRQRALLG